MFLALWYYLHGYVMITVSGFSVERFVNMATFRGIYLWNIQPKGSCVQMNVSTKGYSLLEECAEKTGCRYDIVCRCGLPALLKKYKKRKILSLGVLFFVIVLYSLSSFIWTVDVEGNERIQKEELFEACEKMGMSPGKLKWNINTDNITEKLLEIFPDISWVSVSIKGTDAIIKIVETIPQPEIIDKITPSDLIAKKDSVIQNITAEAGTPMVQSGDVVKKGELLISGEVIIAAGEEAEVGREYIHARGAGQPILIKILSCPFFIKALMQIMDWNPEFNYRILGTWIEKGVDCIMVFNLTKAMPIAEVVNEEEQESIRKRRMAVCPEEWEESFGDEFYEFSMDNELYYLKSVPNLRSGIKCRDVDGQQQISLLSHAEVLESAAKIKMGVTGTDE